MFNTKIHCVCCLLLTSVCASAVCLRRMEDGVECPTCTLTVMCWMNGGIREEGGCSGPSWLMTCCVPQVTRNDQLGPATAALRSSPGSGPFLLANSLGDSIANLGRDDCELFSFFFSFFPFFLILYLCSTYTYLYLLLHNNNNTVKTNHALWLLKTLKTRKL